MDDESLVKYWKDQSIKNYNLACFMTAFMAILNFVSIVWVSGNDYKRNSKDMIQPHLDTSDANKKIITTTSKSIKHYPKHQ